MDTIDFRNRARDCGFVPPTYKGGHAKRLPIRWTRPRFGSSTRAGARRRRATCGRWRATSGRGPGPTRQFVRWTESAPLVNAFGVWLDEQRSRVSPRSRLGEKLTYIANQWDRMLVFLYDGRVEMDCNFVENRIRPVKLTAKNALFAGHDEGARSWGRIGSLIETCKMNGVEPWAWLKSTLEKIAAGHPLSKIHELLPWNFEPGADPT
ncbi:MAG: transposase [Defluviicoccus sp.]|nr:transposase [Defluviicoccus sp.]